MSDTAPKSGTDAGKAAAMVKIREGLKTSKPSLTHQRQRAEGAVQTNAAPAFAMPSDRANGARTTSHAVWMAHRNIPPGSMPPEPFRSAR